MTLASADDPLAILDRWRDWLTEAQAAKQKLPWHHSLSAVFDTIAATDRELGARLAEHLRAHGGLLRGYAGGLVRVLADDPGVIERWASSEAPDARAIAA
ncbi:MAG: hypothetical protein ACRDJW_23150, partial [Thermomicrobiales bacterium]